MEIKTITHFRTFTMPFCCNASYWQYFSQLNLRAAVHQLHFREGLAPLDLSSWARLQQVMRRIKITQSTTSPSRHRKPVTPLMLGKIKSTWEKGELTQDRIMFWAAFLLCRLLWVYEIMWNLLARWRLGRKDRRARVQRHCNWWRKQPKKDASVLRGQQRSKITYEIM